jgi:uncharacterized protein
VASRRPRAGRTSTQRTPPKRIPIFLLGVLVGAVGAGWLAGWKTHLTPQPRPQSARSAAPARPHPVPQARESQSRAAHDRSGAAPPPADAQRHPLVAVIFDDAGYSLRAARDVFALPRPVTLSVLPGLPFSTPIAEEAARRGVQVILHLPVQPVDPRYDPGPGGVTVDMSNDAIARTVAADFDTVPGAVGVNNHMGSRGTADSRVMRAVLGTVKTRGLFFVDSLTTPRSVGAQTARAMGVPTAVRAVFLDNQDNDEYVRAQLRVLMRAAQAHGQAVAIGHVGKVTARVFREMLPEFDDAGIRFVPVSALVH